ncbi:MAG: ATP synthase F0 subunit B [Verrucomicrobia bacterium]|nr:MAG: ATP synthase F0 subunit B [Verrucomicrobiota bacterium]
MNLINSIFQQFGVDWPHFISQVVLFLIVYVVLNKLAFKPVLKLLAERRKRIEEAQLNAEKIKIQLAEAEVRYQEILRKANEEAQALLAEARVASEAQTQKQMQQAIQDAESIIAKARDAIVDERTKMVDEVRNEMTSLVVQTTAKVVGKVLTEEDQKRLIGETLQGVTN